MSDPTAVVIAAIITAVVTLSGTIITVLVSQRGSERRAERRLAPVVDQVVNSHSPDTNLRHDIDANTAKTAEASERAAAAQRLSGEALSRVKSLDSKLDQVLANQLQQRSDDLQMRREIGAVRKESASTKAVLAQHITDTVSVIAWAEHEMEAGGYTPEDVKPTKAPSRPRASRGRTSSRSSED